MLVIYNTIIVYDLIHSTNKVSKEVGIKMFNQKYRFSFFSLLVVLKLYSGI